MGAEAVSSGQAFSWFYFYDVFRSASQLTERLEEARAEGWGKEQKKNHSCKEGWRTEEVKKK